MTTTSSTPTDMPDKIAAQCPRCAKKFLVSQGSVGKQGRCTCGEVFTVESPREPAQTPPPLPYCFNHPTVPAAITCIRCGRRMCQTCAFLLPNGTASCPTCMSLGSMSPNDQNLAALAVMTGSASSPLPTAPPGTKCRLHPQADAMHLCRSCRAPVCATCDFSFPGGIHLCPTCAVSPQQGLTGKRKVLVGVAFALAIWVTAGTALLFSGMAANAGESAATLIGILIGIPAIIGGGVGIACFERRLGNPPVVWVAAIWNIILLALMMILTVIGSFR
ncbi:MAG: hypothetical protein HZA50_01005 [Planctomycetes bacterium]|nr:hypothetical protein [Planctomycetota bacterium]